MGVDVIVKGLLGLEIGDGGGLGKKDGWFVLCGEIIIILLELVFVEKKIIIIVFSKWLFFYRYWWFNLL